MSSAALKKLIVESIGKLQEKTKTDLHKIYMDVKRRHGLASEGMVSSLLSDLVEEGSIIRASLNGMTSYKTKNSIKQETTKDLASEDEDTIEESSDADPSFSSEDSVPVQHKVEIRKQKRKSSGRKCANEPEEKIRKSSEEEKSITDALDGIEDESPNAICGICGAGNSNSGSVLGELLECKDCLGKVHPSCLQYSLELATRARRSPWQCIDCKNCYECGSADNPEIMLVCDACDKGYHMPCHVPLISDKPNGTWICSRCQLEQEAEQQLSTHSSTEDISAASVRSPSPEEKRSPPAIQSAPLLSNGRPISHHLPSITQYLPSFRHLLHEDIPNASTWTTNQVADFFRQAGFLKEANEFINEEIDGASLLLLRRGDVLSGMKMPLGQALKVYYLVQMLQTRGHFNI